MKKTTVVKELEPLVGKVSEEVLNELDLFFINTSLDSANRINLVNIVLTGLV